MSAFLIFSRALQALLAACLLLATGMAFASSLDGTRWRAERLGSEAIDAAHAPTMDFADGRVSGSDGCNRYAATFEQQGDALRFGRGMSTRMACPQPQMQLADRYARMLEAVRGLRRSASTLVLLDAQSREIAVFSALAPARPKEARYTCGDMKLVVLTRDPDHLVLLADKPIALQRVNIKGLEKFVATDDPDTILWYYGGKVLLQWRGKRMPPCVAG